MKIVCIGRNYADHARELGNPVPAEPLFFLKPDSAVLGARHPFYLPDWTQEVHHEIELVVRIDRLGRAIAPEFARRYYSQVTVGIDFTARDVQDALKKSGSPWEKAKAFDGSAVVGRTWWSVEELGGDVQNLDFTLQRNGQVVQTGSTRDMLFPVDSLIAHVSRYMTLKSGDLLFTGTPAGVGPVASGDVLEGFLGGRSAFSISVR
jgi:2-keto-4-pentenoate hydratase/2-oxohepta-3-ene-1,7-dioic acid hydratase in catechol pathway